MRMMRVDWGSDGVAFLLLVFVLLVVVSIILDRLAPKGGKKGKPGPRTGRERDGELID